MSKVAKNIKKLRAAKNISQEQLAEKLHVSRQAVSHWENDRTQPNLQMLEAMAEIFDTEIEELIYGEKRQTALEPDKTKSISAVTVILSVFGSLFIAVGLVFIFVNYWQNFPLALKTVFAFLPVLAGQVSALFVYKKKFESIPWREGGAVLWCAGIVATVAMINSIYGIHCGYENCLIIDGILFLPVIWLFDVVVPLAPFFYAVIHWGVYAFGNNTNVFMLLIISALFVSGVLYVFKNRKDKADPRRKFAHWISTAAAVVFACMSAEDLPGVSVPLLLSGLALLALDKNDRDYTSPYKIPGVLLTCASLLAAASESGFYYKRVSVISNPMFYVITAVLALIAAAAVFTGRKNFKGNIFKTVSVSVMALAAVLITVFTAVGIEESNGVKVVFCVLAFAGAGMFIGGGAKKTDFIEVNAGLLTDVILLMFIVRELNIGTLGMGVMFIFLGAVLLFVNFHLAKALKAKKEKEAK